MTEIHAFDPDGSPSPGAEAGVSAIMATTLDPQIASRVEDRATLTRTAISAAVSSGTGLLDVRDYGAHWDGVTDDSAAIQAAADDARANGGTVFLPAGEGRIAGRVTLYGSLQCAGTLLVDGASDGGLDVRPSLTPITVPSVDAGPLVEGATHLAGLPAGLVGTVYIENPTEAAIRRWQGDGTELPPYYKSEASTVILPGVLGQPLANTYVDVPGTTVTFYPAESKTVVEGLRVIVDGDGAASHPGRVTNWRSRAVFNDLVIRNESTVDQMLGFVARYCADVELNRPVIEGFYSGSGGYGVMGSSTADMRVIDGTISGCRHAIAGQKNKALLVRGGRYEGGIDDHWSYGMTVENLSNVLAPGAITPSHVHLAGRGPTVRNCEFIGGQFLVSIRSDTPEMTGDLTVENIKWRPDHASPRGVAYYSTSQPDRDYGRSHLGTPDRAVFRGIDVSLPAGASLIMVTAAGQGAPVRAWGAITVDDIRVVGGADFTAVFADLYSLRRPANDRATRIRVANTIWPSPPRSGDRAVRVQDPDAGTLGARPFTVEVHRCEGVRLFLNEASVEAVTVTDSKLYAWHRNTTAGGTSKNVVRGCVLQDFDVNGWFRFDFRENEWRGTATASTFSMDGRTISYQGNLHDINASGYPTHPNGYVDPSYYKA